MTVSDGARRAGAAQAYWKRGAPGFYVTNAHTGIPVAGPFAEREEPPSMVVREIVVSYTSDGAHE